jgi:LPS-assembly lipoprotein
MWSLERVTRLLIVISLAGSCAGCFTPLYGTASVGENAGLQNKLANVDVAPIDRVNAPNGSRVARVGVSIRNDLIYDLTGGGPAAAPTHRLDIRLVPTTLEVIVDINTARPDVENYGINATYTLTEIATGKIVVNATTFSRVFYNIPGQEQRFAGARGLRDAEDRAAKVIADNIKSRLASYFVAGS